MVTASTTSTTLAIQSTHSPQTLAYLTERVFSPADAILSVGLSGGIGREGVEGKSCVASEVGGWGVGGMMDVRH